jgi:tRNA wybutosine-synthesizing protein 2
MPKPGPVARLRAELLERAGPGRAALLPVHYQRLGRVVLVRWPEELRPEFPWLARALAEAVRSEAVGRLAGPVEGEWRLPQVERLLGDSLATSVLEDGLRYRFDAERILYSRGNNAERARLARMLSPGEVVVDLFAGIGYFALPAARHGRARRVIAVEENPDSYRYLVENVRRNALEGIVQPVPGDNRVVALPTGGADRVLLGYLPDSLPWVRRRIELLRPEGGWMHLHLVRGARDPRGAVEARVTAEVHAAGRAVAELTVRTVKSYSPGREHVVADVRVRPQPPGG